MLRHSPGVSLRHDRGMTERRIPGPATANSDLRAIKAYMPSAKWAVVMDRAEKAGISASAYVNALIDRDHVDDAGRPVWAPTAVARQELPLGRIA
jgi:hypothetical protein